jgi:hypothetical protein
MKICSVCRVVLVVFMAWPYQCAVKTQHRDADPVRERCDLARIRAEALAYSQALALPARGLIEAWPAVLSRKPDLHVLLGAVGAFGLLQQWLPDVYYDNVSWTDIFSDKRFYQTGAVERL